MNKKLILLLILIISLNANNKYMNIKDYTNDDSRIFMGTTASYSIFKTSQNMDNTMYSYGLYLGLPIFSNYDLIIKNTISKITHFKLSQTSLILNIPLTSRLSEQLYISVITGIGTLKWNNSAKQSFNLYNSSVNGKFYGLGLGKKYKHTRKFYSRFQLDFIKPDYYSKSSSNNIDTKYDISLNYSYEYRF